MKAKWSSSLICCISWWSKSFMHFHKESKKEWCLVRGRSVLLSSMTIPKISVAAVHISSRLKKKINDAPSCFSQVDLEKYVWDIFNMILILMLMMLRHAHANVTSTIFVLRIQSRLCRRCIRRCAEIRTVLHNKNCTTYVYHKKSVSQNKIVNQGKTLCCLVYISSRRVRRRKIM
jgi:hypothetical protein